MVSNAKSKRWISPVNPFDKPIMLYRDLFMKKLVDIANELNYDEFKVEINRQLQVLFGDKVYKLTDDDIVPDSSPAAPTCPEKPRPQS